MSNTTIVSSASFSPEQKEVLDSFQSHIEALIKKDKAAIEEYLDPNFVLIHKDGKSQPRQGFIDDVITGQLNYYKSRIIDPQIEVGNNKATMKVDVEFDCLVYGNKGVFTLKCINQFEKKNNKWYFINWNTNN